MFHEGKRLKLGSVAYCKAEAEAAEVAARWPDASLIAFRGPERAVVFAIRQAPRPDAREVVAGLAREGYAIEILSGDRPEAVEEVARELAIAHFSAGLKPADKIARLKALSERGAPCADGRRRPQRRAGAGQRQRLDFADLGRASRPRRRPTRCSSAIGSRPSPTRCIWRARPSSLMVENLWLSAIYNFIAVPIAILGLATPLIAALAMSGSSILVTLNALRARRRRSESMNVLVYLVPLALALGGLGLAAFLWAMKTRPVRRPRRRGVAGDLRRRSAGGGAQGVGAGVAVCVSNIERRAPLPPSRGKVDARSAAG